MKEKTKKVLCIKDTIGFKKGEIYETKTDFIKGSRLGYDYFIIFEESPEYFQEQKEEEKVFPRWKVGDYVVQEYNGGQPPDYIKITKVGMDSYLCYHYNDEEENEFRNPTEEELSIYFR